MPVTEAMTTPLLATLDNAADLIAATSEFQAFTGTANAAAAKLRVAFFEINDSEVTLPLAMFSLGPGFSNPSEAQGDGFSFSPHWSGSLLLRFMASVTPAHSADPQNANIKFVADCEGIIAGMKAITAVGTNLAVMEYSSLSEIMRTRLSEGDSAEAFFWDWGLTV